MTEVQKKQYLEQYRHLNQEINWNIEKLAEWKSFAERVTASYQFTSAGQQHHVDKIQHSYEKIEALSEQINSQIDALINIRADIEQHINRIPESTLRIILWERYISKKTWDQIAEELHYCAKQVMRLHTKALHELNI